MSRFRPPQELRDAQREMEDAVRRADLAAAQRAQRQLELLRAQREVEIRGKK
jgi:hypothetical protein